MLGSQSLVPVTRINYYNNLKKNKHADLHVRAQVLVHVILLLRSFTPVLKHGHVLHIESFLVLSKDVQTIFSEKLKGRKLDD